MRPRSRDRVTLACGHSSRRISAARASQDGSSGEKIAATATDRMPALPDLPCGAAHSRLVERHDRSAVVIMPAFEHEHRAADQRGEILRPVAERRQRGGGRQSDAHRGDPRQPRRCTTALTKCVVPITTPSIAPAATSGCAESSASAVTMPVVTSAVVGVLTACTTCPSASSTASVLVPPTSMPIRRITVTLTLRPAGDERGRAFPQTPSGNRGRSRRRAGRHARGPLASGIPAGAGSATTVTRRP